MADQTAPPTTAQLEAVRQATAQFDVLRTERLAVLEQEVSARAEAARLEQEVAELLARKATARQLETVRTRLATAETAAHTAATTGIRLVAEVERARGDIDTIIDRFDDPFASLEGQLPVVLLPVRIETRYVGDDLQVRIYPDELHVDQFERLLTADEEASGHTYWRQRHAVSDPAALDALWINFVAGRSAQRAAWIAERTRPVNQAEVPRTGPQFPTLTLRPSGSTRAPQSQLLPGRWLVLGYRQGEEVLRTWSTFVADPLPVGPATETGAPAPSPAATQPDIQDALDLGDAARWITDYDAAVAAGMAVTVTRADVKGGLGSRVDELIVLGVDHRRTPADAAVYLDSALQAQRFTSGLSVVRTGSPTNAGDLDEIERQPSVGDPGATTFASKATAAGPTVARALGLPADNTMVKVPGAVDELNALAADLHTVIWEPTLGYFLRQIIAPLASDREIDQVRDHFRRFVRPTGPLPLLRVGRQPYGLLPVVSPHSYGGDATERLLARALAALRPMWAQAGRQARQLGGSGDPAADLVALLQRTSRSTTYRIREALGPGVKANTSGLEALSQFQQASAQLGLTAAAIEGRPAIVDITLKDEQRVLPVPLVTGQPLSESDPLAPDYVARIAELSASKGILSRLARNAENASTLLEAILLHAATLELVRATTSVALQHLDLDLPLSAALRDREITLRESPNSGPAGRARSRAAGPVGIEAESTAGAALSLSPMQLAAAPLAEVTGRGTLANHLAAQTIADLRRQEPSRQLSEFRTSLDRLVSVPTAELHRTTTDALDALSHRFDAWATSLATRRLNALRNTTPTGIHIGAFGWIEGLRKSSRPTSQGYVHGPSISHATTAAILRSGHLARSEGAGEALAIDLSSRRVRGALKLVEGLRSGQSLGALLGYRFERALRDRGADYARYILPARRLHPLPEASDSRPGDQPVEAIEASNVVDGLRLGEFDAGERAALLERLSADPGHRAGMTAELEALADAIDAFGDLLVSESMFQSVVGNTARAAAALDAIDRQQSIPEVSIARTPRTGTGLSYRLLVVLDDDRPPASWNRLVDHRSRAEPRVNAWVAKALGDPKNIRLSADVVDTAGQVLETVTVDLRDLSMSALSVVLTTTHGSEDVSQLEERLAEALAAKVTSGVAAGLRAHDGPPAGAAAGVIGLGELMNTSRHLADLLSSARPAIGRDLSSATEPVETNVDAAELRTRADDLRSALVALADTDPTEPSLSRAATINALRSAADLGLPEALPRSADHDRLRAQLVPVVKEAARRLEQLDAIEARAAAAHGSNPSADLQVALHSQRIQYILGPDFPVVPRMVLPVTLAAELSASASDPALLATSTLAATEWMLRHSLVRPSVERLWSVLSSAERRAADLGAASFTVAQLPHTAGAHWIGLPLPDAGTPPGATTSVVLHRAGDVKNAATIAGPTAALLVDQWHERVPSSAETTGIAFNFDSPGARPPQSILLAVPPTPNATHWTAEALIDTVREAMQLTRMRGVDLDDLPGVGRFLPALYFAFNSENAVPSFNMSKVVEKSLATWLGFEG